MSAGWKTLDTQNNSLTFDLSEDDLYYYLRGLLDGYSHEAETGHLLD
jgi:hypothetical protein